MRPIESSHNTADATADFLRSALLRRFLPGVAVALGFCLQPQVAQLLAVANAVAEDLVLPGGILRRTVDGRRAVPGRRPHGEIGIDQVRAGERDEVGAPSRDDAVDLVGGGGGADAHGGEPGLVADLVGERRSDSSPPLSSEGLLFLSFFRRVSSATAASWTKKFLGQTSTAAWNADFASVLLPRRSCHSP